MRASSAVTEALSSVAAFAAAEVAAAGGPATAASANTAAIAANQAAAAAAAGDATEAAHAAAVSVAAVCQHLPLMYDNALILCCLPCVQDDMHGSSSHVDTAAQYADARLPDHEPAQLVHCCSTVFEARCSVQLTDLPAGSGRRRAPDSRHHHYRAARCRRRSVRHLRLCCGRRRGAAAGTSRWRVTMQ